VNRKPYKLLHYLLIILLMFAPLSAVVAAPCGMGDMAEMTASSSSAVMPAPVVLAHDMSTMLPTDTMSSEVNGHGCCDDLSSNCSAACDLGVNASLILQETSYAAVYKDSFKLVSFSSKILFRELTPPSRPPANFHS
jgi:hypothetical protein